LDGLRAVAITMVVGSHIWAGGNPIDLGPFAFLFDGDLGVRIFFVLSGFLITHLLIREQTATGAINLRHFFARRALRILPLYLAYLSVLLVLQFAGLYHDDLSSWLGVFTFTRNLVGRGDSATRHLWSLAVEEQFYFLWPVACVRFGLLLPTTARVRLVTASLVAVVMVALLCRLLFDKAPVGGDLLHRLIGFRSAFRYCDSIAIGCLASLAFTRLPASALLCKPFGQLTVLCLWAAVLFFMPTLMPGYSAFIFPTLQAAATAVFVLVAANAESGLLFVVFSNRLMAFVGALSYSIYVWHFMFLSHFFGKVSEGLWFYQWPVWLIVAFLVAYVSHKWLELPFLAMRSRFAAISRGF
jgi:peptidoglycan/LPS O-acetylase OafA/YrhL